MLVHCMARTHGQSRGVTTLCGEASEREDPTLLSPAITRAPREGDWTLIAPVPCLRRRRPLRVRRRHFLRVFYPRSLFYIISTCIHAHFDQFMVNEFYL